MLRRLLLIGLLTVLLTCTARAAEEAPSPEAVVRRIQKQRLTGKDRKFIVAATRKLSEKQQERLLAQLVPLLGRYGSRSPSRYGLRDALQAIGPPALPVLAKQLGTPERADDAVFMMASFGKAAVEPLIQVLQKGNPTARAHAAQSIALAEVAPHAEAAIPELKTLLDAKQDSVAIAAAEALAVFGDKAAAAAPDLVRLTRAPDERVRLAAVKSLGAVSEGSEQAVKVLVARFDDKSNRVRRAAISALGELGPAAAPAVPQLRDVLLHPESLLLDREAAATALGNIGQAGLQDLLLACQATDSRIAVAAAQEMARIGKPAIDHLTGALKSDAAVKRRFAAFALAKMGPEATPAVPALLAALNDPEHLVRRNAVEALGRIDCEGNQGAIAQTLKEPSVLVRQVAAEALATLDLPKPETQAALKQWRATREAAWQKDLAKRPTPSPGKQGEKYLIGGPLAGVVLPKLKGDHGEAPGYPGCVPALLNAGGEVRDMGNTYRQWGPQGQAPQWELYPGSSELWRTYWFKYCPARSMFDRQSLRKIWFAPDIPGAAPKQVDQYRAPVYWVPRHHAGGVFTGKYWKPRPVIRCKVKQPVFQLELGALDVGMYCVRIIGAIEKEHLRPFRLPLFVGLRVNDQPDGGVSYHRVRIGYVDEFYSVAEIYFHAPQKRGYKAELFVDDGSQVALLVHNVTLDDALAGTVATPLKRERALHAGPTRRTASRLLAEERMVRDEALWRSFPPINAQGGGGGSAQASPHLSWGAGSVEHGVPDKNWDEIKQQWGTWQAPRIWGHRHSIDRNSYQGAAFVHNAKLGLEHTIEDMRARRPLPDPYPYKDDGCGLYYPDAADPASGRIFAPIGHEVRGLRRIWTSYPLRGDCKRWTENGDTDAARRAAIALIRFAYQFPSIDTANQLPCVATIPGAYRRDSCCRKRTTAAYWLDHYANYQVPSESYDALFNYIRGNEELAASVSRFVPWVKSSEDVIALLDRYLVQTTAKRILRYHYYTDPMAAMNLAGILGYSPVTAPWVDWVFARTFVYPLSPAGIQNLMITGCDRSGTEYIGSTFYASGEGASRTAAALQKFLQMGVLPDKYDLTRTDLYPKPLAHCLWHLEITVGGRDFPRIGDVAGPDKTPGRQLDMQKKVALHGWRWSGDPRFAWVIHHMMKPKDLDEKERREVAAAARKLKRAPWLDLRSRQVYNWCGVLESGLQHDDFRFRRAAYVRTGAGIGHHHSDTLDLQFFAHGLPMTIDGGQRPGYTTPGDRTTRLHNTVEINDRSSRTQSWVTAIADAASARYLAADAAPPEGGSLYRRQIALIDVDEGKGTKPLTIEQQITGRGLPADVQTANSYIFDVFRVAGGFAHTYCFHGPISDEVTTNATGWQNVQAQRADGQTGADVDYLRIFKRSEDSWMAGNAPERLQATWRYAREGRFGIEQRMLGHAWNENTPRKFTRLHLLGAEGARVYQADANCTKWNYRFRNIMTRRSTRGQDLQSVFVAVVEPYVDKPFIESVRLLPIKTERDDARRAVAAEIRTRNGHRDIVFADGTPGPLRAVTAQIKAGGPWAFCGTDAQGLRVATVVGGSLETPDVKIDLPTPALTGEVIAVDYLKRRITLDAEWPKAVKAGLFEIGTPHRRTSCTAVRIEPANGGTVLTLASGADYLRSVVKEVDPQERLVLTQLKPSLGALPGLTADFTASNDQMTKFWRADYADGGRWKLNGAPVSEADFAPSQALRVWEYGVGDEVRMVTWASVRRIRPGVYRLTGNVQPQLKLTHGELER